MASTAKFSRVCSLLRLTHCRCQLRNIYFKPASRQSHFRHLEPRSQSRWLKARPCNELRCNTRLMSIQTQASEKDKSPLSTLPYNLLDFSPDITYRWLVGHIIEKKYQRLPVKRPYFFQLMKFFDEQETVNVADARTLLEATGPLNMDLTDAKRAEFTRWVWNKIQQIGDDSVKNDIHLFNIYLRMMLDNKEPLTPSEAMEEIAAKHITPNRITYLMLIASACERGDMKEARKQLEEMKKQNFPISISLYNSLISGYCRAGDIEKAEEMFKSIGTLKMEANDMTYANLMLGYAERGNLRKIKELISEMDEAGIQVNTHKALEAVVILANSGHMEDAEEIVGMLKEKNHLVLADIYLAIGSLMHGGHYELAFKVFQLMSKKIGKFFYERAVAFEMPVDQLVNYVRRCQKLKYEKSDLGFAVSEAGYYGEFEKAVALYQRMTELDTPEFDHLYPTIRYYCNVGNSEDLIKLQPLFEKMNYWDYAVCMSQIYSGLRKLGNSTEEAVQMLKKNNRLDEGEFNAAMVKTLLTKEPLPVVQAEVDKMKRLNSIFLSGSYYPVLHTNFFKKAQDWRDVFGFIVKIQEKRKCAENCYAPFEDAKELFKKANMSLEPVVDFMIEHNLKVRSYTGVKVPGVSKEKLDKIIEKLKVTDKDRNIAELEQSNPEDNFVYRHYLTKAANKLDKRTCDGILKRSKFQKESFVDMSSSLALAGMYISFSDADSALIHIRQLCERFPKFKIPQHLTVRVATLLCEDKRYDEALDVLQTYAVNTVDRKTNNYPSMIKSLLSNVDDEKEGVGLVNRFKKVLIENNYMIDDSPKHERPLEEILSSEEEVKKMTMDEVQTTFQNLIRKDQKEELQKASDIFSKHKPVQKVLYRLSAAFAVEGKTLQARKVFQLPGIVPDRGEIRTGICQYFMKERVPISAVEHFNNVLKDTGYKFDPEKDILFVIFRKLVMKDVTKATEFLEYGFEEHGVPTPARAYNYLANAYKTAGKPVPFTIPENFQQTAKQQQSRRNVAEAGQSKGQSKSKEKGANVTGAKTKPETTKSTEVIEAPVSDIIEKSEEIKDIIEQTDPAVEITEMKQPVKEVLDPKS